LAIFAHPALADRRLERSARRWTGDPRPAWQLREHYAIERELASRLANSSGEQRSKLYATVYDDLFSRVSHHPQLRRRSSAERARQVDRELYFLEPLLSEESHFLEIGAGDLALSRRIAPLVRAVHAVDVATEIAGGEPTRSGPGEDTPVAVRLHLTDGRHIPLADGSVTLAYSNQLMEHLHPDDAFDQLREVLRVLRPGGAYLCVTPNRLTGPWDVSRLFTPIPTGLHLCEYSNGELNDLLRQVGFERVDAVVPTGARAQRVSVAWFLAVERLLEAVPSPLRRAALGGPWRKPLNSVRLLAIKPGSRTAAVDDCELAVAPRLSRT
jgi:SAM-dependent methyltransferase